MGPQQSTNLPRHLTRFVGRASAVAAVAELAVSNRLVTLLGPGGVGKSRLALEIAQRVGNSFPDGVWYVDLSQTDDANLVSALVANTFDVGDVSSSDSRPLSHVLTDYFSARQMLLVLDSCEHVLETVSELSSLWLAKCPDLKIMATSRRVLDLDGEIIYRVAPLATEAGGSATSEAVELFVDRLNLIDASRRNDQADMETIQAIVTRLEGLPLAIELAASRTKLFSLREVLDRLQDRLTFLSGEIDRPERHETLLETIEWSYELLDSEGRDALATLSVFNGWTLSAAAMIIDNAPEVLANLIDSSLVEATSSSPTRRYRMLETIREYALQRLEESGQESDVRRKHATIYLDLAQESDRALRTSEQADWLEQVRHEHDNIRAALAWSLDSGHIDLALRLVAATGRFWFIQTHWSEALNWFARATRAATPDEDLSWARAFINTGIIELITQGAPTDRSLVEKAHDILATHGRPRELALVKYALTEWATNPDEFADLIGQSLELLDRDGDEWGIAYVQRWSGSKVELVGDPVVNAQHQMVAVERFLKLGDRWSAGWMSFDLGFSLLAAQDFDGARTAFENALEYVDGINERLVVAHATRGLAAVAAGVDDRVNARRLYFESIPMFERIGDTTCLSFARMGLADLGPTDESGEQSLDLLLKAADGFDSVHHDAGVAAAYRRLARWAIGAERLEIAAQLIGASLQLSGGGRDQLSPVERSAHDQLMHELGSRYDPSSLAQLMELGGELSPAQLISGLRTSTPLTTATDAGSEVEARPEWPLEYIGVLPLLKTAWKLQDDIQIYKGLGGKSGAEVLAVDIATAEFSGQAILKLEQGEWSAKELEAERHEQAWLRSPQFAQNHLPRLVHRGQWGRSSALLVTIASRGLEYTTPWAECAYEVQLLTGRQMIHDILGVWNANYRLEPAIVSPSEVLDHWLDYRLDRKQGRIHLFLESLGMDPNAETFIFDGKWYPNPLRLAVGSPRLSGLGLRPVLGNLHGDLHGYNVLVRTQPEEVAWFLIDMAFYEPSGYLFFDQAYFELAHLLEAPPTTSLVSWMSLVHSLDSGTPEKSEDVGTFQILKALRDVTWKWASESEPDRLPSLQSQILLARIAVGLNFTHKRVGDEIKQRGFTYAMAMARAFVNFHKIDWPRLGPLLALD